MHAGDAGSTQRSRQAGGQPGRGREGQAAGWRGGGRKGGLQERPRSSGAWMGGPLWAAGGCRGQGGTPEGTHIQAPMARGA